MAPGEALQLTNFEPDITGGYRRINGTTKFNTNIVPQVSASTERIMFCAIFNDLVVAGRGGTIYTGTTSGSWTSRATGKGQNIHMILIDLTSLELTRSSLLQVLQMLSL